MAESPAGARMIQQFVAAARADPRIVGLVEYGSRGAQALDAWSDLDLAIFLHDAAVEVFTQAAAQWAGQFGPRLLCCRRQAAGHPVLRTVYDTLPDMAPLPLRVDLVFRPEGALATAFIWPDVPTAVEAVVHYDATGGRLTQSMQRLAMQPLGPPALPDAVRETQEEFWYYLLDTCAKLQRRDQWGTRLLFHMSVIPLLIRLLRLEAGA